MTAQLVPFPSPQKESRHRCEQMVAATGYDPTGEHAEECKRPAIGFCALCYVAVCIGCAEYPCCESDQGHKIVDFALEGTL